MKRIVLQETTIVKGKKGQITTNNSSGMYVLLPEEGEVHMLNSTASFLWNLVKKDAISIGSLIDCLLDEYDATEVQAKKDVIAFVDFYLKRGLVSIVQK